MIYDGAKTDSFNRLNYNIYGMIRRFFLVGVILALGNYGLLQIVLYIGTSITFLAYLCFCKPLDDPR
jgi:hypothetical protein